MNNKENQINPLLLMSKYVNTSLSYNNDFQKDH